MRLLMVSIIASVLGLLFIFWVNFSFYEYIHDYLSHSISNNSDIKIFRISLTSKLAMLSFGLIGVFFGVKSFKLKKMLSLIAVLLAIFVSVSAFVPYYLFF